MGNPVTGVFINTVEAADGAMKRDKVEAKELEVSYLEEQYVYVSGSEGLLAIYNVEELVSLRVERFV